MRMSENSRPTEQTFPGSSEAGRQAALDAYDILDSGTEQLFDDLVEIAQTIAGVPIAYMAFVDEERQWFKSAIGLDASETARNIAFCNHTIQQEHGLVILDAARDPRFADNPLVTGPPYIRFYAGAPIITPEGYAVGTICLSDTEPHHSFEHEAALAALARQAAALLELRKNLNASKVVAGLAADQRDRLWDSSLDMMLITRPDGTLIAGNPAWENVFGPLESDGSMNIADFFAESENADPAEVANGKPNVMAERHMTGKNGQSVYASWNFAEQGDLVFGIARDITRTKEAEAQLAHAQRMDSIGELTGGIAHDFNNLLTIIIGNLDIAQKRLQSDATGRAVKAITHAREGAQRAASLTQRLLAFARRQSLTPSRVSVSHLLAELKPLAQQVLDARYRFEVLYPDALWPLHIDAAQLENAILNLVVNARDAMGDSGRVTLKAGNYTIGADEAPALGTDARAGDFVKICVADTGSGISDKIAKRIFEPFFTTKETGKGTGLGLSQVQGFVAQSGGFVTVHSEPEAGTTISLWLPAADHDGVIPRTGKARAALQMDLNPVLTGKFALLVEDNHDLRGHVAELLREQGMEVTEAGDGDEALAILRGMQDTPQIVLSDIRMPRMDGNQLAHAVAAQWPDLPIVLMTGYAGGELPADSPHRDLLGKPFSPDELVAMMRKHLLE